jgi:hypothetical protein
MEYTYVKPRAEEHVVAWYASQLGGTVLPPREFFAPATLVPALQQWLNANATPWKFSGDSGTDGDEGKTKLWVPSEQLAHEFIALAHKVSAEWVAADRETMPLRVMLAAPNGSTVELARCHRDHTLRYLLESVLYKLVRPLQGTSPDRREWLLPSRDLAWDITKPVQLLYNLGTLSVVDTQAGDLQNASTQD